MSVERVPSVGERWIFRHWVGLRYQGAVEVLEVGEAADPRRTRVVVRFETSGNELVTTLAAFVTQYRFESHPVRVAERRFEVVR